MERFHQSQAKVLVQQCPAVLRHQELHGRESTDAMDLGNLLDYLVFGHHEKFEVVEVDWGVYASGPRKGQPRDKNWKAAAAQARFEELESKGVLGVLQKDVDDLKDQVATATAILANLAIRGAMIFKPRIKWTSSLRVECEGEPDLVIVNNYEIRTVDLKRSVAISPRAIQRQISGMAWDLQGAAYKEAAMSEYPGRAYAGHTLLACQSGGARLVETYTLDDVYMTIGQMRWEEGQRVWMRCQETGAWPGYTCLDTQIGPTRWQVHETIGYDESDDDLSELGLHRERQT